MLHLAKIAFFLALLLVFAAIGVGCLINPDWGIKQFASRLHGGGELRKDWNRMEMSFLGLVFVGFAVYLMYVLISK